jgi:outer membrane lipase/esterase
MINRPLLAGLFFALVAERADAQTYNQFIAFGDSTIDSGWFRYVAISPNPVLGGLCPSASLQCASIQAGGAIPTTPNGPMNSTLLASYFGLTANPADQPGGGTNYAASGAQNLQTIFNRPSTPSQIATYLASTGGVANPNALYFISSGGNDISKSINPNNLPITPTMIAQTTSSAQSLLAAILTLKNAGAQYFFSNDESGGGFGGNNAQLAQVYYHTLWSGLAASGVNFVPGDMAWVVKVVTANASLFGFQFTGKTNGNTACNNPNPALIPNSWALYCTPALMNGPNAGQIYLWADDEHLSAGGQKIEADYNYSLLVAPSEISFMAEVPLKTRAGVISAIQNQIPLSLNQSGAYHGWVSGDMSWLKLDNSYLGYPNDPGTPVAVTTGFDFRMTPNWLIGAAFSGGFTTQTYSLGGQFHLNEFAVSGYAAYLGTPVWATAIASAGVLSYDSNRQVPIGIQVVSNYGDTSGTNLSFAAQGGYDFRYDRLTHGPVAGIIAQHVRVNGFTETDQFAASGGMTALSFQAQTLNSAVSELGYQVRFDAGLWQPFAKAVWDHELANANRSVTASLTTPLAISFGAPSYSLPAVVFGKDWGTVTAGTWLKFSNSVSGVAAFFGQFAQGGVQNLGGQIGLNIAFAPDGAGLPVKAPILK